MDKRHWAFFDLLEGYIWRQICNLNSLSSPYVLQLEFGLPSTVALALVAVPRRGNFLLRSEKGTTRAALMHKIFDLRRESAFLRPL